MVEAPKLKKALEGSKYGYLEVSGGTFRTYDLFHAFRDALKLYAPFRYISENKLGFYKIPSAAKYNDNHPFWGSQEAHDEVLRMEDHLSLLSPEGFYFGASQGDGACFGWWKDDDATEDAV